MVLLIVVSPARRVDGYEFTSGAQLTDLKQRMEASIGCPAGRIVLTLNGADLDDGSPVDDYNESAIDWRVKD